MKFWKADENPPSVCGATLGEKKKHNKNGGNFKKRLTKSIDTELILFSIETQIIQLKINPFLIDKIQYIFT